MDEKVYLNELESLISELTETYKNIEIKGNGLSSFLSISCESRGIEIYRNNDKIIIDPSINGELQGELEFNNYGQAVVAANQWLNN